MPAALLTLLLPATIDLRLAEPLCLLAEIGARDTADGLWGDASPSCLWGGPAEMSGLAGRAPSPACASKIRPAVMTSAASVAGRGLGRHLPGRRQTS